MQGFNYNNGNNNSNARNVNTKIKTFFGDLSCLQLGYWNDMLSIKINPLMNISSEGLRNYDYNRRVNTSITVEKSIAIVKDVKAKIFPEVENVKNGNKLSKKVTVAFPVGQKGVIFSIEYKQEEQDNAPYFYLVAYTAFTADGKVDPAGTFAYKFAKTEVLSGYDSETGEAEKTYYDSEFEFFFKKLETLPEVIASAAHSVNVDNAYKSSAPSGGNNSYQNNNGGGSNYSAPVGNFSADQFPFS